MSMPAFHSYSIRKKLILLFTATASLAVLVACTTFWVYLFFHSRMALQTEESAMAQLVAESSAPALLFNDGLAASETLAVLRSDPRIEAACLYDKHGLVVAHFGIGKKSSECPASAVEQIHFIGMHLIIFRQIRMRNEATGSLYLNISLAEMYGFLLRFAEIGTFVLLMASLFATVLSSFLQRIISEPILHLTRVATEVSNQGSYILRARRFSTDETGILIDQFNAMMERIQQREEDLQQAHDSLEDKVAVRTQDLSSEIAERKLIERDLEVAKSAAEESNRAKSAFLANMSHELRTPLNAIIGYSEMLAEDAQELQSSSMLGDVNKVLFSARHLLSLISDILDISKIEAGHLVVQPELVLASSLLKDVLSTAEVLAKRNQNVLQIAEKMWDGLVEVDPLLFRQCLLNLLSNSCKFTENGSISLSIKQKQENDQDWVLWSVSDTGIGISPESHDKLFHTFSQVDSSSTRKHGGSGLGLAISQQLCQVMNGHITVESKLGAGSTFTIHMPAHTQSMTSHLAQTG